MSANVNVTFKTGVGSLVATLYRDEVEIANGQLTESGTITFDDAESEDSISINGASAGTTHLEITMPTTPSTPIDYPAGDIFDNFLIN